MKEESAQQKGKLFKMIRTMETGSQYSNTASVQKYFENVINRSQASTQALLDYFSVPSKSISFNCLNYS